MTHARCLAEHVSTCLAKGDLREDGHYYRCLRDEDVKRVFRDDDEGEYGYKVRPEKWTGWSDADQESGLSVTESVCARTPGCAIHFHSHGEQFRHVVKIDLAALSRAIGIPLTAIFDPVSVEPQNPCHFVIVPVEASIDDVLISLGTFMAKEFPPNPKTQPKKPRKPSDIAEAKRAKDRYDSVFSILREVVASG